MRGSRMAPQAARVPVETALGASESADRTPMCPIGRLPAPAATATRPRPEQLTPQRTWLYQAEPGQRSADEQGESGRAPQRRVHGGGLEPRSLPASHLSVCDPSLGWGLRVSAEQPFESATITDP